MSAWTVENGHIDVLVNAMAEYGVVPPDADFRSIGHELWRGNVRSVNFRYSERKRSPRYTLHTTEAPLHPVAVLKAIGCYEYQACEHPGWERSRAYLLCEQLRNAILAKNDELTRMVPGPTWDDSGLVPAYLEHPVYKSAPWGFDDLDQAATYRYAA